MSTDPNKLVKSILLTYFLAVMFLLCGFTSKDFLILFITFLFISFLLILTALITLIKNYKKYKISMYMFLFICGAVLILFSGCMIFFV